MTKTFYALVLKEGDTPVAMFADHDMAVDYLNKYFPTFQIVEYEFKVR